MSFVRPAFQAQNPAISGYSLGWSSCTAFAGAMAASFDKQVAKLCTGGQVRRLTGDTSGGLTLAEIDAALLEGWDVNLNTIYRLPWADFVSRINAGRGAVLQGWYAPIADSKYDAGNGFRRNHAIFVPPDWAGMDPLADGRTTGVYKFHAEPYPQALLRDFAGRLNLSVSGYSQLGSGLCYASFTRDNERAYRVSIHPTPPSTRSAFFVYTVASDGTIVRRTEARTSGFSADCTAPRLHRWPSEGRSVSLVQLTSGARKRQYVSSKTAKEV